MRVGVANQEGDDHYTFSSPEDVTFNPYDEEIVVADTGNDALKFYLQNGTYRGSLRGVGGPVKIIVLPEQVGFVILTNRREVIWYDWSGNQLSKVGPNTLGPSQWSEPVDLGFSRPDLFFVVDRALHVVLSYKSDNHGQNWNKFYTIGLVGEAGNSYLHLRNPSAVTCLPDSSLVIVSDTGNARLLFFGANGRFIAALTSFERGKEEYQLRAPTTLGVLTQPAGKTFVIVQDVDQLVVLELEEYDGFVNLRWVRSIDGYRDVGGIHSVPSSDLILVANTSCHTFEVIPRPFDVIPEVPPQVQEQWDDITHQFESLRLETKSALLNFGTEFAVTGDLLSRLEQLRSVQKKLMPLQKKVEVLRLSKVEGVILGGELKELAANISNLRRRVRQGLEETNDVLKERIRHRLMVETQITESNSILGKLEDQLTPFLEQIRGVNSWSHLQDLLNDLALLEERFSSIEIPKLYTERWLSEEFQRDLRALLKSRQNVQATIQAIHEQVDSLVIRPGMQIQKRAHEVFESINKLLEPLDRFFLSANIHSSPSNLNQLVREQQTRLAQAQALLGSWETNLTEEDGLGSHIPQAVSTAIGQYKIRFQSLERKANSVLEEWRERLVTDAAFMAEFLADLSRIFGKRIPLVEVSVESGIPLDSLYNWMKELISSNTLNGHLEVGGDDRRSTILHLGHLDAISVVSLEERKAVFRKILQRYRRINIERLCHLLKMPNTIELEAWLLNLPNEYGFFLDGDTLHIGESVHEWIDDLLVRFGDIESSRKEMPV